MQSVLTGQDLKINSKNQQSNSIYSKDLDDIDYAFLDEPKPQRPKLNLPDNSVNLKQSIIDYHAKKANLGRELLSIVTQKYSQSP